VSGGVFEPVPPEQTEPLPQITAPLRPSPPAPPPKPAPPVAPSPPPAPEPDTGGAPGLDKLALILLLIAFVLAAKAFTDFFNWLFRTVLGPLWPKTGSRTLSSQAVTKAAGSYLGTFASGFDSELGVSFTAQAETVNRAGRLYLELAERILKLAVLVAGLEQRTADAGASRNALRHQVQQTAAQQRATAEQLATTEATTQATIHALGVRVDELQHSVKRLIEPELEQLRGAIPSLEKGAASTWEMLLKHENELGIGAMVGTVAVAMGRLGAGWTQCENTRAVGEQICGSGGNTLRRLLQGSLPALGLLELCSIGRAIVALGASSIVTDALGVFSSGLAILNKCMGATNPAPLPIAPPDVGPLTAWAELPPVNV